MAQKSRFFDSVGGDRVYASAAWAEVVGGMMGDGVVAAGNALAVSESSPPAMSVRVNTGKAYVRGYYFEVYSAQETLVIGAAHATLPRIDRIVVRRDLAGRTAILAVLAGTAAASPVAPALTQVEAGIWEISLAQVAVPAAAASIVNANITDDRGPRAKGTDIDNLSTELLDPTTGHRHEGSAGTGRKVQHADTTGISATDHHPAPVAGPDADVVIDAAGAAGTAATFARSAHGHKVATTAGPDADVVIDAAGAAGSSGSIARAGHGHKVTTTAGPGADDTVDAAGAAGATGALARAGHGHRVNTGAGPGAVVTIDAAGAAGATGAIARVGHGHQVNTTAGPGADDTVDGAGAAGATGAIARTGHGHRVNTTDAPSGANVSVDAAASAAAAGTVARATHGHRIDTSAAAPVDVGSAAGAGAAGAIARSQHVHAHPNTGSFLPDAHHAQSHSLASHTGVADDINAWAQASQGGGAAGTRIWVGTTDPGGGAGEGDVWIKA